MNASYRLEPADDTVKDDLLRWRNADVVRKAMVNQEIIAPADHAAWWERLKEDRSKRYYVLRRDDAPVGVVNFFDIEGKEAWWGFVPAEEALGGGTAGLQAWFALEQAAVGCAFEHLGLDTLLCETRRDNKGVLALHDRIGFETLQSDSFPNAVKHGLIVKCLSRQNYERARSEGRLPMLDELEMRQHPLDREDDAAASAANEVDESALAARIAVLGNANWDLAARELAADYERWTGHRVDVFTPAFGQAALDLLDPQSDLRRTERDFTVFAERLEDFVDPFATLSRLDEATARERFERHLATIRHARAEMGGTFIIHDFWPVRVWPQSLAEKASGEDDVTRLCLAMNQEIAALAAELPDTVLLPISSLVREVGTRNADPGKYWMLGRIAYAKPLVDAWCAMVTGIVLARRGQTARVLVLDLDNTLWGGVIGDDGMGGIQLGSDYPGNEFKQVQSVAAALKARGIPLALCSKNTERIALEAIGGHPEMVLGAEDFAATRINWMPKSQNIRELAEELSLGLGSLMFVDDNPLEREEVRRSCPGVIVPEMPDDVSAWPAFLINHPALTALALSSEDMKRAQSYDIRRQVRAAEKAAPSRETFLKELGMTLEVLPVGPASRQRVVQLIAKTNQFNTTTKRYSAAELEARTEGGGDILTLRLKDKFGSDEVIGVVVVDYDEAGGKAIVDNFIMSCRVLGRGVEAGALAIVSERARRRGFARIEAAIVPTERNEPCHSVFVDNGFSAAGDFDYVIDISEAPIDRPDWLTIKTEE